MHITPGGKVNGTFKFVTGFTAFNSQVVEEQSGYYVPFKVDVPAGASKVQMKMQLKLNGLIWILINWGLFGADKLNKVC